jgi:hypothetical protein
LRRSRALPGPRMPKIFVEKGPAIVLAWNSEINRREGRVMSRQQAAGSKTITLPFSRFPLHFPPSRRPCPQILKLIDERPTTTFAPFPFHPFPTSCAFRQMDIQRAYDSKTWKNRKMLSKKKDGAQLSPIPHSLAWLAVEPKMCNAPLENYTYLHQQPTAQSFDGKGVVKIVRDATFSGGPRASRIARLPCFRSDFPYNITPCWGTIRKRRN